MTFAVFLFVVLVSVIVPVATSYNSNIPSSGTPAFSRRDMLVRTTFVGGAAFLTQFSQPSIAEAAGGAADMELIKTTSDRYRLALTDKAKFIADMAAEDAIASPLPSQIPAITFQKLAKVAHDVADKLEADDFPFVAIEYAEHAGAARDLAKLSRLGRIGENGSPEVALDYAKRCVLELEEASVILDTLRQAVE